MSQIPNSCNILRKISGILIAHDAWKQGFGPDHSIDLDCPVRHVRLHGQGHFSRATRNLQKKLYLIIESKLKECICVNRGACELDFLVFT